MIKKNRDDVIKQNDEGKHSTTTLRLEVKSAIVLPLPLLLFWYRCKVARKERTHVKHLWRTLIHNKHAHFFSQLINIECSKPDIQVIIPTFWLIITRQDESNDNIFEYFSIRVAYNFKKHIKKTDSKYSRIYLQNKKTFWKCKKRCQQSSSWINHQW